MILSDGGIRRALQRLENPLIIDPGFDPARLQPASLELTLAPEILVEMWEGFLLPATITGGDECQKAGEFRYLHPGCFVLASTVESVRIPTDMVAQVNGKSSHARRGLVIHQTAGFIDPGFKGQITLELSNASQTPIKLAPGMVICQLVFTQMESPSERPYGSKGLGSHYQGQVGPTRSALSS